MLSMDHIDWEIKFAIKGEPASKANSRKLVTNRHTGKTMFIKSKKALDYVDAFRMQCPRLNPMMEGDLVTFIKIFYASRRPDLDESVILDAMQGLVYENDRQVKLKIIAWGLDKEDPRAEIYIKKL